MTPEQKLERIAAIYQNLRKNDDGSFADSHARHNLEGALIDMTRTGKADAVCLSTVNRVIKQLGEIEHVLGELVR